MGPCAIHGAPTPASKTGIRPVRHSSLASPAPTDHALVQHSALTHYEASNGPTATWCGYSIGKSCGVTRFHNTPSVSESKITTSPCSTMNLKLILTIAITAICTLLHAEDKPLFTYEGEVAGVVCSACSGRVKGALTKLDGVKSVKITLGKDGALPRLVITSSSPSLTKEAAVKALGSDAQMYDIRSLKRAAR